MNTKKPKEIDSVQLAELAVECWRLDRWIVNQPSKDSLVVPKHVARRLKKFLEVVNVSVSDFAGRDYDPGLAVDVIDAVEDQALPAGTIRISETLSPLVMIDDVIVKQAEVVLAKGLKTDMHLEVEA